MAYPFGWSVIEQTMIRKERWPGGYQIHATPLVYLGQQVVPDQPVLRVERAIRADEAITPMSPMLSLPSVTSSMSLKAVHEALDPTKQDRETGEIEFVPAGMQGRVVAITRRGGVVIESNVAVVRGAIGAGKQVAGVLTMWQPGNTSEPQAIPPGAILVVPGPVNFMMLRQAMVSGVVGVVASSISTRDLEGFLATDLIELVGARDVDLAQVHLPSLTLFLTEGLGTFTMSIRVMNLLSRYRGAIALVSGITSVRHGMYPELVISLPTSEIQQNWQPVHPDPIMRIGTQVRVCGGDREGAIGVVDYLFAHQQVFASGVRARAVRLRLEDGSFLVVPITLIERVG